MNRAERRHINKTKARRKKKIIKEAWNDWINSAFPFNSKKIEAAVKSDNYWSKHQIGCSCWMCKWDKKMKFPDRQRKRANDDAKLQMELEDEN